MGSCVRGSTHARVNDVFIVVAAVVNRLYE